MEDKIRMLIIESRDVHEKINEAIPQMIEAVRIMVKCIETGGKIMFAGNGGSAADAQHLAAELVNRMRKERRPIAGLALTTDASVLTAIGNDYSFDQIFSKQVLALGRKGDILVGISTSGDSMNIVKAIETARDLGIITISLTGECGRIKDLADCAIAVPSRNTQRIQEAHILIGHILCELLEDAVCRTI
jgi:D-sedoheptulose 7-phosphate isomerase